MHCPFSNYFFSFCHLFHSFKKQIYSHKSEQIF
nr:MAG TPA: hypothetical protein [Caudoviricetes sp.]